MCAVKRSTDPNDVIAQDSDVMQEANRVNLSQTRIIQFNYSKSEKLIFLNLKTFGTLKRFKAIKEISIGISKKECLGLLRQNGAGKTTMLKMSTEDTMISKEIEYIHGFSVKRQLKQVRCLF